MSGLTDNIHSLWIACASVEASPAPGGTLQIQSLSKVLNQLDHALTTIRTLDLEVFQRSDETAYLTLRNDRPKGQAVRALTGPRSNAIHGIEVIDPDIVNALGPLPDRPDQYIVIPRWKPRSSLPDSAFHDFRGRVDIRLASAYESAAAGRPVFDTIFDAFQFFDSCDPRLAERDDSGNLANFPLPPLPLAHRYRRLHPNWSSEEEWERTLRDKIAAVTPGGLRREIIGSAQAENDLILCGYTILESGRHEAFTEHPEQVAIDIANGYSYIVIVDDHAHPLQSSVGGELAIASGVKLDDLALPLLDDDDRPWVSWWSLCQEDADYYRRNRARPL